MERRARLLRRCPGILIPILILAAGGRAEAQAVFRAGVDLVHFGVTVVDRKGEPVTGLTAEDFEIRERGTPQTIVQFAAGDASEAAPPPLHLGVLLDTSGSMSEDIAFARTAAIRFLNTLTFAEDITLVDFDTEVRVARYGQADFPRLVERIRSRKADGWTALYDALGVYLDGASSQEGRKILVLYTDGGDTRSSISFATAVDLLKASDVIVYAIGFLMNQPASMRTDLRSRLLRITELTGGQAFFPLTRNDLDGVFERIEREIKAQYTLGYISTDPRMDGSWRTVRIRVVRPELKGARVRTRQGYFALYRDPASDDSRR
jgi:Ca-activated chloride channel family protein